LQKHAQQQREKLLELNYLQVVVEQVP